MSSELPIRSAPTAELAKPAHATASGRTARLPWDAMHQIFEAVAQRDQGSYMQGTHRSAGNPALRQLREVFPLEMSSWYDTWHVGTLKTKLDALQLPNDEKLFKAGLQEHWKQECGVGRTNMDLFLDSHRNRVSTLVIPLPAVCRSCEPDADKRMWFLESLSEEMVRQSSALLEKPSQTACRLWPKVRTFVTANPATACPHTSRRRRWRNESRLMSLFRSMACAAYLRDKSQESRQLHLRSTNLPYRQPSIPLPRVHCSTVQNYYQDEDEATYISTYADTSFIGHLREDRVESPLTIQEPDNVLPSTLTFYIPTGSSQYDELEALMYDLKAFTRVRPGKMTAQLVVVPSGRNLQSDDMRRTAEKHAMVSYRDYLRNALGSLSEDIVEDMHNTADDGDDSDDGGDDSDVGDVGDDVDDGEDGEDGDSAAGSQQDNNASTSHDDEGGLLELCPCEDCATIFSSRNLKVTLNVGSQPNFDPRLSHVQPKATCLYAKSLTDGAG